MMRPFFTYYGGKYRAAPLYPPPKHSRIVEPFAPFAHTKAREGRGGGRVSREAIWVQG